MRNGGSIRARFGIAGVLAIVAQVCVGGTTYYVDPAGSNGDGMSWETAKQKIQNGINLCGPGDTVLVRGDNVYYDSGENDSFASGTPALRITYQGVPGTGAGNLPVCHGSVELPATNFVPTNGYLNVWFIAQNPHPSGVGGVYVAPAGTSIDNDDAWISYAKKTSITDVQNQAGSFYDTESVSGPGGIYVHTHDETAPVNFRFQAGHVNNGFELAHACITVAGFRCKFFRSTGFASAGGSSNTVIRENRSLQNGSYNVILSGGSDHDVYSNTLYDAATGVQIQSGVDRCTVHDNIMHSHSSQALITYSLAVGDVYGNTCYSNSQGLYINQTADIAIYDNVLYENSLDALYMARITRPSIYNNTFYNNGRSTYAYACGYATFCNNTFHESAGDAVYLFKNVWGPCTNATVFNNIIWVKGAGARCINIDANSQPGFASDYNDLYADAGAHVGYWGGNRTTLADWTNACGQDAHSLSVDPVFVDAATSPPDLHIQPTSLCRDYGLASFNTCNAPATDIDGDARPAGPGYDLGSDEWVSGLPPPPDPTVVIIR